MPVTPKRLLVFLALVAAAAAIPACRAATQAELEISTTAQCSEIGSVAIVVSGDSQSAEDRVGQGFYAAQTTSCDASRSIGSLVVTPGSDRAAVVVIAPPVGMQVSECLPPKYTGCIVARRAFSFIDHVSLTIPISLDVECKDVPCDAFSTCRKGACYSSDETCDDSGNCAGAGDLPDGGLSPDAEVSVDGSPPHEAGASDSGDAASTDSGDASGIGDAGDAGDAGSGIRCDGETLSCDGATCAMGKEACCTAPKLEGAACGVVGTSPACTVAGSTQYCCTTNDCATAPDGGTTVMTLQCNDVSGTTPGTCGPPNSVNLVP